MRTRKLRLLSAFLALAMLLTLLPTAAFAANEAYTGYGLQGDFTVSRLNYTINADGNTVTLVGSEVGLSSLNIPSTVDYNNKTYTVTVIGSYVANKYSCNLSSPLSDLNETLLYVTIPDTVTTIGDYAFIKCSYPENINIPASVKSIGNYAFYDWYRLKSVKISGDVESIGDHAFYCCSNLASINIPNSVKSIGAYAFYDCQKLASITIPNGVTSIKKWTFYRCLGLTSVTLPDSVTSIGEYAFCDCYEKLESINIPDGVTSIGAQAFYNCSKLKSIHIPAGVQLIGRRAFSGCSTFTSVTIPGSVTGIKDYVFEDCRNLNDIKFNGYKSKWDTAVTTWSGNSNLYKTKYLCDINFDLDSGKIGDADSIAKQTIYSNSSVKLSEAECYNAKTGTADGKFTIPAGTPTKTGYKFTGWSDGKQTYTSEELANYAATDNVTFTANYVTAYNVTFDANAGDDNVTNMPDNQTVAQNTAAAAPNKTPERTGYTFDGWYTAADESGRKYTFDANTNEDKITQNTTLYAHWSRIKYTVTFHANAGNDTVTDMPDPLTVEVEAGEYATNAKPDKDPKREGYTFNCWIDSETTGYGYKFNMPVTGNLDLYASWDEIKYTVKFEDRTCGTSTNNITVKYSERGQDVTLPTPTAKGYDFEGWYTEAEGGNKVGPTIKVTEDMTLYAHWTVHSHKVMQDNDGVLTEKDYNYNESVTLPKPAKKDDHNFNGWTLTVSGEETVPELTGPDKDGNYSFTMPDCGVTATAKWTKKNPVDPDKDLKFDPATGEVTSKSDDIKNDDITDKTFWKKNEDGSLTKVDDKELVNGKPTEPGTYVVKVDVNETENTASADDITGTNPKWEYTVPDKGNTNPGDGDKDNKKTPSADDFTYDPSTGKVTPKDDSGIGEGDYEQKFVDSDGNTVPKEDLDPDTGLPTKPGDYTVKVDVKGSDKVEKKDDITGTDPEWKYTVPEEPAGKDGAINPASVIVGAGVAVVGGAALGWQAYNLYAELAGYWMLPAGFAFPTTREMLALALWNDADQPAAVNNTKYSDLEEGSESQTAARWAVENELIKPLDDEDTSFGAALPVGPLEVYKAFKAEKAWQKANK